MTAHQWGERGKVALLHRADAILRLCGGCCIAERRFPVDKGTGSTVNGTNATLNVHVMRHQPFFLPLQGDPRFDPLVNDPKNNAPLF